MRKLKVQGPAEEHVVIELGLKPCLSSSSFPWLPRLYLFYAKRRHIGEWEEDNLCL